MESLKASDLTFLDLSDVDDQERARVLFSLHSENSCVQLPWKVLNRKVIHKYGETLQNTAVTTQPQVINHKMVSSTQSPSYLSTSLEFNSYINQPQKHFVRPHLNNASTIYPIPITYSPQPASFIVYPQIPSTYPHPQQFITTNTVNNVTPPPQSTIINMPVNANTEFTTDVPQNISPLTHDQETAPSQVPTAVVENTDPIPINQHNGVTGVEVVKENSCTPNSAGKSWASLFNKSKASDLINNANIGEFDGSLNEAVKETNNNKDCPIRHPRKGQFVDPNCYRMGEFLLNYVVDGRTISLQPRGLINRSNYCYINSILQALLACPPIYNLLVGLSQQNTSNERQKLTPIIDGMSRFVKEFQHLPAGQRVNRRSDKNYKKDQGVTVDCDLPFEPSWIYKMLNGVRSDSFLVEGRQEDAEEFLGFLLNGLNDEMLEIMKLVKGDLTEKKFQEKTIDHDDKEWQVMGPKNKGGVTRQFDFIKTPVSDIFGGFLKSRIHRAGDQSTYNIQPFFTLQLNIEKVKTVREALEALVTKNQLEGVTSEKTNEEVEAWQQVTLEELPVILILHLKCFDFKLDGCTKIVKALEFPIDLKIDSKMLSKTVSPKEKQYKLFAVVYHDGKEATKGHYITDAFHVGYSSWIRYDDASVKPIQEENVLKPQGTRVPYLLFYRRSDTIRSK